MKKLLFLLCIFTCLLSCGKDEEIPVDKPQIDNSKPEQEQNPEATIEIDSVFYSLDVEGFELVAASKNGTSLFLQSDSTFAFSCLFDSCGTNRLVAYCDSIGVVERIVIDEQIINILYHEDEKKIDLFYKNADNKISWIKELENPYKKLSSRAESGDVPYSAISIASNISDAVYSIINITDIQKVTQPVKYKFISKSARKETYKMNGIVALKLITQILGQEYKISAAQHLSTVIRVMSDYANWVQQELYGDAIPALRPYAYAAGNSMSLAAYVTEVDSSKTEFKLGIMATEDGKKLNAYNFQQKKDMEYNPQNMNYPCSFSGLETGKKYKFRPYLLPASTSKYMKGLKGLLDYYRMNFSFDYRLLETKAQLISTGDNHATVKLSVENADISIKMGVIYSEHSDILNHEYKNIEYEPTFEEGIFSNNFEKEIKLENLKSDSTYYYMPYIVYDDDVLNRNLYPVDSIFTTAVITEKDQTFYGKKESFTLSGNSLRDILKRIYNECNGKNWKHQKNWMTDLPVTEWEGVERTERKGRSADYLYHFKFMAMNNLTGTLTIENCSENIVLYNCDYANNKLEGLHLKNCPNLYLDNKIYQNGEDITPFWMESSLKYGTCYIGIISNHLKNLYLDNISMIIVDRDNNLFYKTIVLSSKHDEKFFDKWENLEIKNYKDIAGIVITNCSKLKNIVCENNSFLQHPENYRDREYIIDNCPSLENISFKHNTSNQEFGGIFHYISKCHNLKEVILENPNDFTPYYLEFNSSQIDEVRIKNANVYLIDENNFLEGYEYPKIKEIYVDYSKNNCFYIEETVTQNIKLENLKIYSHVGGDLNFHNNQTIKNIEIMGSMSIDGIIDLNGCVNLERFDCPAYSMSDLYITTIDVRNTPRLKEFICNRANVKEILFDSHMNADDLLIKCNGLNILQELPDCYEGGGNFLYDRRYDYIRKENGEFETIDHGRGWWYPGEPESLNHHRYN